METIHLKTVDPISQDLLRSAAQRGIKLNWERYEKLQPQDGFLRLGLSCPFGCMQGPCRIDPFGRGPDRGLCGLDRDGMAAALLLRLALQGALETMGDIMSKGAGSLKWSQPVNEIASRALKNLGKIPLSVQEIYQSASLLERPMESPERLIQHALRLGLLTLNLLEHGPAPKKSSASVECEAGYGLLSKNKIYIGISGRPSPAFLKSLLQEARREPSIPVQLVSLGEWVFDGKGYLPFACTSGEGELLLSSGRVSLLAAGPKTDPGLLEICRTLEIPLVKIPEAPEFGEILRLARQAHGTKSQAAFSPDASLKGQGRVTLTAQGAGERFAKKTAGKTALLGGADTLQQSLGWIPVEVAAALRGEGYRVAAWGDAALWMIKNGLASTEPSVDILDPGQGPWPAVKAMASSGTLENLKGICFTGLKQCQELSMALGLSALGLRVCVASLLPVWGSEKVRNLLAEKLAAGGGTLAYFDHPAQAAEILEWFTR